MADFNEETQQWIANAQDDIHPYGHAQRNGTHILSVVRQVPPGRGPIRDQIVQHGELCLRIVEPIRRRPLTLRCEPKKQRVTLDASDPFVRDGAWTLKVMTPEPHPRCPCPEEDYSCRFEVKIPGHEGAETQALGLNAPVISRFYAELRKSLEDSPEPDVVRSNPVVQGSFQVALRRHAPDVMIITALRDERECVLRVLETQLKVKVSSDQDRYGFRYHFCELPDRGGKARRLIIARANGMGETKAATAATRLMDQFGKPKLLVMVGICAGNPEKTCLGDVVVAQKLFKFDSGKREVVIDPSSSVSEETVFHDVETYKLSSRILRALEDFADGWPCGNLPSKRPKTYTHQLHWFMCTLSKGLDPQHSPERAEHCASWTKIVETAIREGWVRQEGVAFILTESGRQWVGRETATLGTERFQDRAHSKVVIGAMGTSAQLQKDERLFRRLQKLVRTIVALDMEAVAVAEVAADESVPCLVVKAVVDFADLQKDDNFRMYSGEVAGAFVSSFLASCGEEAGLWA